MLGMQGLVRSGHSTLEKVRFIYVGRTYVHYSQLAHQGSYIQQLEQFNYLMLSLLVISFKYVLIVKLPGLKFIKEW